jgi:hypothetical protein
MNCTRCHNELNVELAAKFEILKKIFGREGDWLCDSCQECFEERLKRLWHRLICKTCWEYHNWWDLKQWLKWRKPWLPLRNKKPTICSWAFRFDLDDR